MLTNLRGDVRNWAVNVAMTSMLAGVILIATAIGKAVWNSFQQQPAPWTILISLCSAGVVLMTISILLLIRWRRANPSSPSSRDKPDQISPQSVQSYEFPVQDYSDPAYDHFFQTPEERIRARRDKLITRGQLLIEQWTTRFDYPEKYRRETDSKNWLCEAGEFASKHLAKEQMKQFTSHHKTATSPSKKYDFCMALTRADTQPSSEDGNLALEIFGKVTLLERFRSEPIPPLIPSEQLTRGESRQLKARRDTLKNLLAKKERIALKKSSPGFDMDAARRRNEKYIEEVREDIKRLENEHPVEIREQPLSGVPLRNGCDKWVESGRSIHVRLARGERDAISEAKKWLDGLLAFSEINLSISEFDKIHNSNVAGDTFHREMAKLDPSKEVIMYERLLSYRIARLIDFRNRMK
jgi:hypothetical protein